ncbi:hypothetical protein F5Y12DRAFT_792193 [Xylaria sp. FL1777]|nr:hypothetical protein F5Y12DRAFT_792193 [Xylaria sp. FL1777]
MAGFNILRAATAFVVLFWCGVTLAASHRHKGHRNLRHAIHSRSGLNVEPFLVTVMTLHPSSDSTLPGAKPQNISAYLVGEVPDPANPAERVGFVAQQADRGATTYFMPPSNTGPGVASAAPATLSWKTGSIGSGFKTPGIVDSGRVYIVANGHLNFYASEDKKIVQPNPHNPTDIASQELWGFIELTHTKDPSSGDESMVVNLSFVDWVSLPLGMSITSRGRNGTESVTVRGLAPNSLEKICEELSSLEGFWPKLCMRSSDNTPLRIMSPEKYVTVYSDDHDAVNYYEPYIDKAWEKYKDVDLKINTQVDGPNSANNVDNGHIVTCRVGRSDDILYCDNDAGKFVRPVSGDIYGCASGPFASPVNGTTESWSRAQVRPRLCAALVRSTLHLDGIQPSNDVGPDKYYQEPITNHYSRIVHENLIGGLGYAFSYDDVNPSTTENSAGLISISHPIRLDIHINM